MIRWLHISDLHFNSDDMSTLALREELPKFLKRHNIYCDYVFCTGDIRNAVTGVFSDEAAEYLKNLCTTVGCDVDRLFIVSGNHDINRKTPGRDDAIERVMFQRKGYYDSAKGIIYDDDLRIIHEGQKDFRTFLSKVYDADRLSYYENPLVPHFNIETPDFNILHVDTTIVQRSGQEANDLIVGTKALYTALKTINPEKPTILLTHFPFMSLSQDEKKQLSERLYSKGIDLWLAGHEHDHNLQKVKYLYSVQAGELRLEDKAHATVLIGNYEPITQHGDISAYTWFTEGWAKYPIIDHENRKEDEFPFALRLLKDDVLSREAVLIAQANKQYLQKLPENVVESIFPGIQVDDEEYKGGVEGLLSDSWNSETPHIILLADGGMGKSTMLLSTCKKMENALYISVESLSTMGYGIEQYCAVTLFDGKVSAFQDYCRTKHTLPDLLLLIDGLNEVDGETERGYISEIRKLNLLKGIQVIISSRSDFTPRYSMSGYRVATLEQLTDDQVKSVIDWDEVAETPTLLHLLRNPMMLTMYKEVSPIIDEHKDIEFLTWKTPIQNATDLLYNYYVSQIAVLMNQEGKTGEQIQKAARAIFYVLPAIAYQLESNYRFNIKNKNLREMVKEVLQHDSFISDSLEAIAEYYRTEETDLKAFEAVEILVDELHLLHRTGEYTSFPHQIYRDYLSACWIVNETERDESLEVLWNIRGIPRPVMEHIRRMSGDYWSGIAEKVHEDGKGRDDVFHLVGNLLDCFPYQENGTLPDYSGLDLRHLQLPNVSGVKGRISLKDAKIDKVSIGKRDAKPAIFNLISFSEDNAYLAAVRNGQLTIYSLQTSEKNFWQSFEGGIRCIKFAGDYLFAVIEGRVAVIKKEKDWQYIGDIKAPKYTSLFNARIRKIILKDEQLYFYYNNRIIIFRLSDCMLLRNDQVPHAWEKAVDGYDLTSLSSRPAKTRIKQEGIISRVEHNGLIATARDDGDLRVTSGKEILNKLSRGITLLKDGAISGNGRWAVTLSYEIFAEGRKIQYWNLDEKTKVEEFYCPEEISHLHLSETGNWIIGETEDSSWVMNIQTKESTWFEELFISNQHSKLVTYGNKVFRKNADHDIYLYDLGTGKSELIENRQKNARIATLMPDGTVASVGNNSKKVLFVNSRNGNEAQIDTDNQSVLGIYGLKKHPFLAAATQDGVISIYHTGTEKRTRIIRTKSRNYIVAIHPEESVIACTDGYRLGTCNYYEKQYSDKKRGWWYQNLYEEKEPSHPIYGRILDIAFNEANHELVVIVSNGEIIYCNEKYCGYHSNQEIITNFNIDSYDFTGCICDGEIKNILWENGANIDVSVERSISDDTVERWKKALETKEGRKRIRNSLVLHQEKMSLSPNLEILSIIYKEEISMEFQEEMIKRLS